MIPQPRPGGGFVPGGGVFVPGPYYYPYSLLSHAAVGVIGRCP